MAGVNLSQRRMPCGSLKETGNMWPILHYTILLTAFQEVGSMTVYTFSTLVEVDLILYIRRSCFKLLKKRKVGFCKI